MTERPRYKIAGVKLFTSRQPENITSLECWFAWNDLAEEEQIEWNDAADIISRRVISMDAVVYQL